MSSGSATRNNAKKKKENSEDVGEKGKKNITDQKKTEGKGNARKEGEKEIKWYCMVDGSPMEYDEDISKTIERVYQSKAATTIPLKNGYFQSDPNLYVVIFDPNKKPMTMMQVNKKTNFQRQVYREPPVQDLLSPQEGANVLDTYRYNYNFFTEDARNKRGANAIVSVNATDSNNNNNPSSFQDPTR
ncbi:hypothetical protein RFI_13769 [Reticulomyxa filosa]|uniref:WWE domain-containing protein n=1 Tax=Reticulomyxa filosa TaxID=46433 RepID=X6L9E4_RETFI|nr:hypothetical protein RFI_40190 [Reticulomyxa filosa]ETO23413.1 hypothetical protein RFI_13769 [Reticulomyxa filosa]|eukprot:ETN97339.1 hypothetical protein RFI_40190 [Reticulomyxa filosa]